MNDRYNASKHANNCSQTIMDIQMNARGTCLIRLIIGIFYI